jgi:hypothetical protein
MTTKKLDAAEALRRLAEIRKGIPFLEESAPRRTGDGRLNDCRTLEDFDALALAEGLENLADDLSAAIEKKRAEAMEAALRIYYAAEELARDPANAHVVPLVERMREAYERDFGRAIPPKPLNFREWGQTP